MALQSLINAVLGNYLTARDETFTNHPVARLLRREIPDQIRALWGSREQFIFKGSAGQGQWSKGPWVAMFFEPITTGAMKGYYPVYLFAEDMSGVYLSLNQAMTEAKNSYQSDAKTALRARAADFRARLGSRIGRFALESIDLHPDSESNDTSFYEAGNICATHYKSGAVPDDATLERDLREMLDLYLALVDAEVSSEVSLDDDQDAPSDLSVEDGTKFRFHKKIERNRKLVKDVKKLKGTRCEVCELSFSEKYGPIGDGFIEAHHLKPIATLVGLRVTLDPARDFAVLCSNCHRMVHLSGLTDDIARFKREVYRGK